MYVDAQPLCMRVHSVPTDPNIYEAHWYVHDRLGSVRQVLEYNEQTFMYSIAQTCAYTPFGEDVAGECYDSSAVTNPWKFTGQWYDAEIGQYYLRARQYDPQLMRFSSRELLQGQFNDPFTLHRYLYCSNDPINFCDFSGLRRDDLYETPRTWSVEETQDLIDECSAYVAKYPYPIGPLSAFSVLGFEYDIKFKYMGHRFQIAKNVFCDASEFGNYLTSYVSYLHYGLVFGEAGVRLGGHYHSIIDYGEPDDPGSRYFIAAGVLRAQAERGGASSLAERLSFVQAKFELYEGLVRTMDGYKRGQGMDRNASSEWGVEYDRNNHSDYTTVDPDQEFEMFLHFWNSGRLAG